MAEIFGNKVVPEVVLIHLSLASVLLCSKRCVGGSSTSGRPRAEHPRPLAPTDQVCMLSAMDKVAELRSLAVVEA